MLISINLANAQSNSSIGTIALDKNWHFCPTQSYQPNIDIAELTCYPIEIPNGWESVIPKYDGFGLLYTKFHIPKTFKGTQLAFKTRRIRDADKVFINGTLIGGTGEFPPHFDKAVFYTRLYSIPIHSIKFGQENTIAVWVYNDARPGGIRLGVPVIASFEELISTHHTQNLITLAFIIVLLLFGLINFINLTFNIKSYEILYYGLFLFAWSAYLFTASDLVLLTNLSLGLVFKFNVVLFFTIYSLFLLFIYAFFKKPLPITVKIAIAIALACIPLSFFLSESQYLYKMVALVELLTIPTLYCVVILLIKVTKEGFAYARIMSSILGLYIFFGFIEIIMDYLVANEASSYSPFGPWLLIAISVVLTFIVSHKNMAYYHKATIDGLTNTLRFERLTEKLSKLINRAEKEQKSVVLLMVDLDDFKQINDKHGHIQGDKVLILVSDTMREQLNNSDLLARYGGDEFCIAAIVSSKGAKPFVDSLHKKLNALKIQTNNQRIQVSVTIGASILTPDLRKINPEMLVKMADDLLIRAKLTDKGKVMW